MKSIFRYPGGKTKPMIQKWITDHMPTGVKEYREPFVGGGGVFFALSNSGIERKWINDKHEGLIAVYEALRDRPKEFVAACREIEPPRPDDPLTEEGVKGGEPKNARLKEHFDQMKLNTQCDQALRYFFVNRTVHGSGRVNYDIPSRLYFSNPDGWNITAGEQLEKAAKALTGTKITSGDFEELLTAPGKDVWIYLDPPYVVNTALTATSQLYQHSFTTEDHRRFAAAVQNCRHRVCISYDDDGDGFVRSLFPEPEFRIVEGSWKYAGTTDAQKREGRELLILNYEPPQGTLAVQSQPPAVISRRLVDWEGELELCFKNRRTAFVRIGEILGEISESGEYKATHHTFKKYLAERWGLGEPQASRFVNGAAVYREIASLPMGKLLPDNERQVRELTRLPSPDQAAEVWKAVTASVTGESQITAAVIRKHVNEAIGYERPKKPDEMERLREALRRLPDEKRFQLFTEFFPQKEAA